MKLKQIFMSLVIVGAVFFGLHWAIEHRPQSQLPPAVEMGDFTVIHLDDQPTAIQKPTRPNADPIAKPAPPLDHRWQNPSSDEDADDPDSLSARILGPFAVAMLLLGLSLWALYEQGRKKREQEQKSKRNCNVK